MIVFLALYNNEYLPATILDDYIWKPFLQLWKFILKSMVPTHRYNFEEVEVKTPIYGLRERAQLLTKSSDSQSLIQLKDLLLFNFFSLI